MIAFPQFCSIIAFFLARNSDSSGAGPSSGVVSKSNMRIWKDNVTINNNMDKSGELGNLRLFFQKYIDCG